MASRAMAGVYRLFSGHCSAGEDHGPTLARFPPTEGKDWLCQRGANPAWITANPTMLNAATDLLRYTTPGTQPVSYVAIN